MKTLSLENVYKDYLHQGEMLPVLNGVSLCAAEGEFISICGPSGCGKSTILHILSGMLTPDKGAVHRDGSPSISMMSQKDMLLPWRTVLQNAVLPAELSGMPVKPALEKAGAILPLFGLEGFGNSYPSQLSGGMLQRAALLRTYLSGGNFWLLDEPFGKLDAITRESLQNWLLRVGRQAGAAVILVTHDIEEAVFLSDRIYILSERPGKIISEFDLRELDKQSRDDPRLLPIRQSIRELLATNTREASDSARLKTSLP